MIKVDKPSDVDSRVKIQIENVFNNGEPQFLSIVKNLAQEIEREMFYAAPLDARNASKGGNLRGSISTHRSKKNKYFMWVGPRYSNRRSDNKGNGGNHAHLVEYGSKARYMKKGLLAGGFTRESDGTKKFSGKHEHVPYAGKYTGIMTAKPFIRPTYDKMGAYIVKTMKDLVENEVIIQAQKQGL